MNLKDKVKLSAKRMATKGVFDAFERIYKAGLEKGYVKLETARAEVAAETGYSVATVRRLLKTFFKRRPL